MPQVAALPQANYEPQICAAIKRAMSNQGWTYKTLAEALGEKLHTVWNWLNGRAPLPAKKLPLLVQLNISEPLKIIAAACEHELKPSDGFLRKYHSPTKPIAEFQLDCWQAIAEVNKTVGEAKKDHRFNRAEQESIKDAADKAITEILELVSKTTGGWR